MSATDLITSAGVLLTGFSLLFVAIQVAEAKKIRIIQAYQDLDKQYNDLLLLAMKHPEFMDKSKTDEFAQAFDPPTKLQYELFAYVWWNICETIFDQTYDPNKETEQWKTWKTVLWTANRLHRNWLLDIKPDGSPQNKTIGFFKESFRDYVRNAKFEKDMEFKVRTKNGTAPLIFR